MKLTLEEDSPVFQPIVLLLDRLHWLVQQALLNQNLLPVEMAKPKVLAKHVLDFNYFTEVKRIVF